MPWGRRAWNGIGRAYGAIRLAGLLARGLGALGRARPLSVEQRLAALPVSGAPVSQPVGIRWDGHQIPFIEAATDADLAVALGVVHAHLRLSQMEVMRRLAHGRVAEVLGPLAVDLDHQLRGLDLGRATSAILGLMPEETRRWLDGFVAGINHVIARAAAPPPEFRLLGLACEPWTVDEVVTVGRLASADLNWIVLFNAIKVYRSAHWQAVWTNLMGDVYLPDAEDAIGLATSFTHTGSNALAVAGWRNGGNGEGHLERGAIVAGDPHLDLVLPNFWLLGGIRSPSLHAVGLMIPGLPFIAMGRNRHIAWSGTSLHAASTDLYDASDLPFTRREERIRTRWWDDQRMDIRETRLGPIITDARPMSGVSRPVALRWMGHRPSDEFTAMLALNRAADWPQFLAAASQVSVPGQTLLYGDTAGHIGKCLAVRLPVRQPGPPGDLLNVAESADPWQRTVDASQLPHSCDPPEGRLVSANLPPAEADVAVAYFHSPPYREERMAELLDSGGAVTMDDVIRLQRDVHSRPSLKMRDWLFGLATPAEAAGCPLTEALLEWDGEYHRDSVGAVAYERLLYQLLKLLEGRGMRRILAAIWDPAGIIRARLMAMAPAAAGVLVRQAIARADRGFSPRRRWGSVHRLRLPHLLGHMPVLGRLFTYGDYPWPGGNETLMKAAHSVTDRRHPVRYGANARFVADLSDLDRTQVVLVGGQDGWLGSANFMDQVELWHQDRAICLPMRSETVHRLFPHQTVLTP